MTTTRREHTTKQIRATAVPAILSILAIAAVGCGPSSNSESATKSAGLPSAGRPIGSEYPNPIPTQTILNYPCRVDDAERWQIPSIAVAYLPVSADAAEHRLTREIAVNILPRSADSAERWLCGP